MFIWCSFDAHLMLIWSSFDPHLIFIWSSSDPHLKPHWILIWSLFDPLILIWSQLILVWSLFDPHLIPFWSSCDPHFINWSTSLLPQPRFNKQFMRKGVIKQMAQTQLYLWIAHTLTCALTYLEESDIIRAPFLDGTNMHTCPVSAFFKNQDFSKIWLRNN